jgi:hypothetical protein
MVAPEQRNVGHSLTHRSRQVLEMQNLDGGDGGVEKGRAADGGGRSTGVKFV